MMIWRKTRHDHEIIPHCCSERGRGRSVRGFDLDEWCLCFLSGIVDPRPGQRCESNILSCHRYTHIVLVIRASSFRCWPHADGRARQSNCIKLIWGRQFPSPPQPQRQSHKPISLLFIWFVRWLARRCADVRMTSCWNNKNVLITFVCRLLALFALNLPVAARLPGFLLPSRGWSLCEYEWRKRNGMEWSAYLLNYSFNEEMPQKGN